MPLEQKKGTLHSLSVGPGTVEVVLAGMIGPRYDVAPGAKILLNGCLADVPAMLLMVYAASRPVAAELTCDPGRYFAVVELSLTESPVQ